MVDDFQLMQKIKGLGLSLDLFTAALIANESGGIPWAQRYEPAVERHLWLKHPDWTPVKIRYNSTSWGLTQIMGYHVEGDPLQLMYPDVAMKETQRLRLEFNRQFSLAGDQYDQMFRCWNTGHPDGTPYDPDYVANGLRRMEIWKGL